jgi:hypothetical protein
MSGRFLPIRLRSLETNTLFRVPEPSRRCAERLVERDLGGSLDGWESNSPARVVERNGRSDSMTPSSVFNRFVRKCDRVDFSSELRRSGRDDRRNSPRRLCRFASRRVTDRIFQSSRWQIRAGPYFGETFSSPNAPNGCVTSGGRVVSLSFRAKGQASGPFPGTYTLTGETTLSPRSPYFSETFMIKSGSKKISGSASTTNVKAMNVTCNSRTHRSISFSFTNVPANVENTLGLTSLGCTDRKFRQTFR